MTCHGIPVQHYSFLTVPLSCALISLSSILKTIYILYLKRAPACLPQKQTPSPLALASSSRSYVLNLFVSKVLEETEYFFLLKLIIDSSDKKRYSSHFAFRWTIWSRKLEKECSIKFPVYILHTFQFCMQNNDQFLWSFYHICLSSRSTFLPVQLNYSSAFIYVPAIIHSAAIDIDTKIAIILKRIERNTNFYS